ncbi:Peptidase S41 family protein [Pyrenophora tritici-repentis]|nr:Peptidase S41 family protein [Pyrenophora tritici-repentis]
MKTSSVLALASFAAFAAASPIAPTRTQRIHKQARQANGTTSAPCARVSEAIYGDDSHPYALQVSAGIAWDCLNEIPFNASSATELVKQLRPYINWQSTLDVLKDPPAEYQEKVQAAVDILGGLDKIDADINAGNFKNEYDFGFTLYRLILSAHDGHFTFVPDSVGSIFTWGRPVPLVSVSADGEQLPAVFAYADVLGMQFKNITYTPSAVVEIDGKDATEFLEEFSQFGSLQDRDALYNNVFYSLPQVSLGTSGAATGTFSGGGRGRLVYPGPTTTLTFANGTSYTMENFARPIIAFRGITTGKELAERWIYWGSSGQASAKASTQEAATVAVPVIGSTAPGYPTPIEAGPQNLINGYYIDAPGYEDVAVLSVPNFVGNGGEDTETAFKLTTQNFLPKAAADGKTKLIIDLQANGGGTVLQGYDMFKQLFPDQDPYGASRFRAHEALDLIGQATSQFASKFPRNEISENYTIGQAQSSYFDYNFDMKVDGTPFSSWDEKIGPQEVNGALYTTLVRYNLTDPYIPYIGIDVSGYNQPANVTLKQRFKPENIVLLTDGYCASTCTIFAEFMKNQVGVKSIAMGGRSNKKPIQAIGGVKGTNNYAFSFIQQNAQKALDYEPSLNTSILATDYGNDLVFSRSAASGVNVRDGLRKNDTSGIALQFIYEEADCRLYYTPEMTTEITSVWKAAADSQWGNKSKCVGTPSYGDSKVSALRLGQEVTTKLSRPGTSAPFSESRMQAFEDSFNLFTDNKLSGDGYMLP